MDNGSDMLKVRGAPLSCICEQQATSVVLNRLTREVHELTSHEHKLISHCHNFALPSEHASIFWRDSIVWSVDYLIRHILPHKLSHHILEIFKQYLNKVETSTWMSFRKVRRIADDISHLTSNGLFLRDMDFKQPMSTVTQDVEITRIGIPTRNRLQELGRCLTSISDSLGQYGRTARVVIAEMSQDLNQVDNILQLSRSTRSPRFAIECLGPIEIAQFINRLSVEWGDRDLISFAFDSSNNANTNYGAARNLLLVANHGNHVFNCDDDVVWRGGIVAEPQPIYLSHVESIQTKIFNDRDQLLDAAFSEPIDVLGQHQRLLGKEINTALRSSVIALNSAGDDMLVAGASQHNKIRFTYNGVAGDCGSYSSTSLVVGSDIRHREYIANNDSAYHLATRSREIIQLVDRTTVTRGTRRSTMMFGQDCTGRTIPYFPKFRNEDGIMACLISNCELSTYSACLPFYLHHLPIKRRSYNLDWVSAVARVRMSDVIRALCLSLSPVNGKLSSANLGFALRDIASSPLPDFTRLVQDTLLMSAQQHLSEMAEILDTIKNKHSLLGINLQVRMKLLSSALLNREYLLPVDLPSDGRSFSTIKNNVAKYGSLLAHWDELMQAAEYITYKYGCIGRTLDGMNRVRSFSAASSYANPNTEEV